MHSHFTDKDASAGITLAQTSVALSATRTDVPTVTLTGALRHLGAFHHTDYNSEETHTSPTNLYTLVHSQASLC